MTWWPPWPPISKPSGGDRLLPGLGWLGQGVQQQQQQQQQPIGTYQGSAWGHYCTIASKIRLTRVILESSVNTRILSTRAGRVRELKRSSRSKFKMVWYQFNTVQFPSHQFVWKVRTVQFRVWGRSASVQFSSVQARISPSRLQ